MEPNVDQYNVMEAGGEISCMGQNVDNQVAFHCLQNEFFIDPHTEFELALYSTVSSLPHLQVQIKSTTT